MKKNRPRADSLKMESGVNIQFVLGLPRAKQIFEHGTKSLRDVGALTPYSENC